jgi:hypothetical protein
MIRGPAADDSSGSISKPGGIEGLGGAWEIVPPYFFARASQFTFWDISSARASSGDLAGCAVDISSASWSRAEAGALIMSQSVERWLTFEFECIGFLH